MRPVRIGCSGWVYADWRGDFYPHELAQREWLPHYATHFDTVEVNATFYRLPKEPMVARWAEETPTGFLFAVKGSRYLTHIKRLTDLGQGLDRFYDPLAPLIESRKLGPVLWQLPGNFKRDDERLAAALDALDERPGDHCFEFRHASWFVGPVFELLRRHGVALVIGDDPSRPFQTHELTTDWTYVRFHRGRRGRRGNYSEAEL